MLRSCYATSMAFGPSGPVVPVQWYFVPAGRAFVPYATVFNSLNWTDRDLQPDGALGEVWNAPRPYSRGLPPAGACQTLVPVGTAQQWALGCGAAPRAPCVVGDTRPSGPYSCEYSAEYA
jgi:hypothetical protein